MKRNILLFTLGAFCLSGCAAYRPELFLLKEPIALLIPSLLLEVDRESLIDAYPARMGIKAKFTEGGLEKVETSITSYRYEDSKDFIERELNQNVFEPSTINGKVYGTAVCRIIKQKTRVNYGWFIASTLTLYTINSLGFPIGSQTSTIEVELEILDWSANSIGKYSAMGKGTAYSALYWGYNMGGAARVFDNGDITRAANLRALSDALKDIENQIQGDAKKITNKLLEVSDLQK